MTALFLLALAAAPAAVALRTQDQAPAQAYDPCTCLSWGAVYLNPAYGASCHTGRELGWASVDQEMRQSMLDKKYYTQEEMLAKYGKDWAFEWSRGRGKTPLEACKEFFPHVLENFCVNWNYNSAETPGKQWCYVSSKCTDLGEGINVNDKLSYKTCTSEKDVLLSETPVITLQKIARRNGLDLVELAKWSYLVPGDWQNMTAQQKKAAKESGVMQFFGNSDGKAPFRVIPGKPAVWTINFGNPPGLYGQLWRSGQMDALKCVEGCSGTGKWLTSAGYDAPTKEPINLVTSILKAAGGDIMLDAAHNRKRYRR